MINFLYKNVLILLSIIINQKSRIIKKNKNKGLKFLSNNKDNGISICIPCYEMSGYGAKFLERLLSSIVNQSYKKFEIIIVDQSVNNTDIYDLYELYKSENIKYFKQQKKGASASMNLAIEESNYNIIKPMFQDDFIIDKNLLYKISKIKNNWGIVRFIHTNLNENYYYRKVNNLYIDNIFGHNTVGNPSVIFFKKSQQIKFDENLINFMDMDFYHQLFNVYGRPELIKEICICVRIWGGSITNSIIEGRNGKKILAREKKYLINKYGYKPNLFSINLENEFGHYKRKFNIYIDDKRYVNNGSKNIFIQIEPKEIINNVKYLKINYRKYEIILCWEREILDSCPNAVLFPFGSSSLNNVVKFDDDLKKFQVSFLTSNKNKLIGHKFRNSLYNKIIKEDLGIKVIAHRSPPYIDNKYLMINEGQYSIVVENVFRENWFTEKIIDIFLMKVIPIYKGAPNIGDFFNINGILTFNDYNELCTILNKINKNYYNNIIDIVEENYRIAIKYSNFYNRVDNIIKSKYENCSFN